MRLSTFMLARSLYRTFCPVRYSALQCRPGACVRRQAAGQSVCLARMQVLDHLLHNIGAFWDCEAHHGKTRLAT